MNKKLLIVINIVTGLFVVLNSIVGFAMSGIGEVSTNNIAIFVWVLVWAIGLALQFKQRTQVVGLIVTFIPVVYFIYLYTAAAMM